ncbi:efflux transporter outer membrane subunit [Achromobacter aloeverae]|uniref:RND transporter n=1 Tax=Achromobacter aloeverae TaxID=1750518 RepID=A0A4Q1HHG1_9BURK|nr:efflux transporter outer membrane subunit [Achromobacter aloeverae]RXN86857.1 RND transporter [Achromobacter aloeverae]
MSTAMMKHAMPALALPLTLALLAGCAVGPDYERPVQAVPAHFARADMEVGTDTGTDMNTPAQPPADADAQFWRGFGDDRLAALVGQALMANQDLKLALARYDAANALLANARLDRYPTVTASGQVGHQLLSKDQAFGAPRSERDTPTSSLQANASWELDLFGRVRRGIEAQQAEVAASAADARAMRVAVAAEVASAYVALRGAQARLRIARANAENQKQTLTLIQARIDAGRGSDLDLARARAQWETTASRVAVHEATIGVSEHRLAVLTARPAESIIRELDAPGPLPRLDPAIDPGTPAGMLRRRPDVAAAEARLHAATARIGVATADLFPRLTLGGLIGSASYSYGVFRSGSDTNLIALGVDWSFLDIGRVRARIAASHADATGLLAQYQQTVQLALEDTENALLRSARIGEEAGHLQRAASDSAAAVRLADARFRAGAIDYYQLLDAQREQLQAQDAAADADTRGAAAAIALYKALAGGWNAAGPAS